MSVPNEVEPSKTKEKHLCAGCTRTHKHLETDKSSNIYRHLLKKSQCKSICDEN